MDQIKKILVVSRSTQHCAQAIDAGFKLAKDYAAHLSILHIIHDPFDYDGWDLICPYDKIMQEEYKKYQLKTKNELDKIIAAEKELGVEIKEYVIHGDPVEKVLDIVKQDAIDLIIEIAHPEDHRNHFLFGHHTDKIVRELPCSVLLLKSATS